MKRDQIRKNVGDHVRIEPGARTFNSSGDIDQLEEDWIIESDTKEGLRIKNTRTADSLIVGFDHIHSYMSDPNRNHDGIKHGILILNVQINVDGDEVFLKPTERPGKPLDLPRPTGKEEAQHVIDEYYAELKNGSHIQGAGKNAICALVIVPETHSVELDLSKLHLTFSEMFKPILFCRGSCSPEITGGSGFTRAIESANRVPYAVTEVSNFGEVKAYNSLMLRNRDSVPSIPYKREIISSFERYLNSLRELGLTAPFFINTAMLNVRGYKMHTDAAGFDDPFKKEDIVPPLSRISKYTDARRDYLANALRSMFSYIWREFGGC